MKDTRFFGFWIVVRDEISAQEAVKMSGLPVLVMGGNLMVTGAIDLAQSAPNMTLAAVIGILAMLLILLSFRIRAGHSGWLPLVLVLFGIFLVATAYASAIQWITATQPFGITLQLIASWIVQLFCIALVGAGLRGWNWLRKHEARISF